MELLKNDIDIVLCLCFLDEHCEQRFVFSVVHSTLRLEDFLQVELYQKVMGKRLALAE